jgi:hypothetical protein
MLDLLQNSSSISWNNLRGICISYFLNVWESSGMNLSGPRLFFCEILFFTDSNTLVIAVMFEYPGSLRFSLGRCIGPIFCPSLLGYKIKLPSSHPPFLPLSLPSSPSSSLMFLC